MKKYRKAERELLNIAKVQLPQTWHDIKKDFGFNPNKKKTPKKPKKKKGKR